MNEDLLLQKMRELLDERTTSYFEKDRDADEGEVRIGTGLTLREDLYSLCFLFWFLPEFVFGDPPNEVEKLTIQAKEAKKVHEKDLSNNELIRNVKSETLDLDHVINKQPLSED